MNDDIAKVVIQFNEALNRHDVQAMMVYLSEDTVFENTYPPPDGERYAGKEAVRDFWQRFFEGSSRAHIEIEEIFAIQARAVMRWTYHWIDSQGVAGHIRGVDLYRVEGGLIKEKLSYVKG